MILIGFGDVLTALSLPSSTNYDFDKDFDQNRNAKCEAIFRPHFANFQRPKSVAKCEDLLRNVVLRNMRLHCIYIY